MSAAVEGAGGVVFNPHGEVLLIHYPKKRGGGWSFPKGHIDPGETTEIAAVREVLEEGNVQAEVVANIGTTEYVNPKGVPRRIHWFAMRTQNNDPKPEPGFEARFFSVPDALERITHAENRTLLETAVRTLEGRA